MNAKEAREIAKKYTVDYALKEIKDRAHFGRYSAKIFYDGDFNTIYEVHRTVKCLIELGYKAESSATDGLIAIDVSWDS